MSIHRGVVSPAEHAEWFARTLASDQRMLLIGEDAGLAAPIGVCRFDADDSRWNSCEVSLAVAPERRGRGYGRALLTASLSRLRAERATVTEIRAVVRDENTASLHVFEVAGFRSDGAVSGIHHLVWTIPDAITQA